MSSDWIEPARLEALKLSRRAFKGHETRRFNRQLAWDQIQDALAALGEDAKYPQVCEWIFATYGIEMEPKPRRKISDNVKAWKAGSNHRYAYNLRNNYLSYLYPGVSAEVIETCLTERLED